VANEGQDILAVVIEVVLPGIFLDFHLLLAHVLHVRLTYLLAQLLESLNRGQEERVNPLRLVWVNLARLHRKDRSHNDLSAAPTSLGHFHLIFKCYDLVGHRLQVLNRFVFVNLEGQVLRVSFDHNNTGHLTALEGSCSIGRHVKNVIRGEGLFR
jgi:hypothetical protein